MSSSTPGFQRSRPAGHPGSWTTWKRTTWPAATCTNVVRALIAADGASIDLAWETACAIDLAGRDILDAVQTSRQPEGHRLPGPDRRQDARSTPSPRTASSSRPRPASPCAPTSTASSAAPPRRPSSPASARASSPPSAPPSPTRPCSRTPTRSPRRVLAKGLDAGTAFEILSIDIADVDVGENIGAKLQADQAEADKQLVQAEAEKRRAMAVARSRKWWPASQENRAKVVAAEAEMPLAIAEAFRNGNLGVMDYYRMKNIQADTEMRRSIAGGDSGKSDK